MPHAAAAFLRLAALGLAAALSLFACGGSGGVDSGGTGSFASGPISGFGSVIVNGVHFDDAGATVSDDDGTQHFEQALFADGLSARSMQQARKLIAAQWKALLGALAPEIEKLIDEDGRAARRADQRLRVGLYSYAEAMPGAAPGDDGHEPGET